MMDVDAVSSGLNEDRLIFYSSPGTLASLASSKMALFCWSYEIRGLYPDEASRVKQEWFIEHKFSCVDVYETPLPSSIVEKIDHYIKIIGAELTKWMDEFDIFIDNTHDVMLRCIDHIIESNGIISYTKTARSLLDTDEMNSYEKCTIAYTYCFESDMKRLLPSMLDDPSQRVPSCSRRKIPSIYCWDRLSRDRQSSIISSFRYRLKTSHEIKFLLPKLSPNELSIVFRYTPTYSKTFIILADNEVNCHYAIQLWNYLLLNGKITHEVFFDLLRDLCKVYNGGEPTTHLNYSTHAGRRILLRHIWFSAPDNLKSDILNQHVSRLFSATFDAGSSRLIEAYGLNMDFFLDLLTKLQFQQRSELWDKYWCNFVAFAAASDLKKIMELCLPKDDIAEFKKQMVNHDTLKSEFDLFVTNGRYLELENYLKSFCSSDAEEKLVKIQIIDSNMSEIFHFDFETLKKFSSFIDNAFSPASLANKRKEGWFRENLDEMYTSLDKGSFGTVKNIANLFLSHNPEYLAEMKQFFFARCQNNLISGSVIPIHFSIRHWQEFIKWCTHTDDDFIKFKSSLPLDDIFEAFLVKIIERGRIANRLVWYHFAPMSNFLLWYFNDGEAVKKFLSGKLVNYQQVNAFRNLVEEEDSLVAYGILKWFFDGDEKQARIFHERAVLRKKFIDDQIWNFA